MCRRRNWNDPGAIDFHGYRSLQERHRNDQPVTTSGVFDNAFQPIQRPALDAHVLAHLKERVRPRGESGLVDTLKRSDLEVINGSWSSADSNDTAYAGRHQYWTSGVNIEAAEDITRK